MPAPSPIVWCLVVSLALHLVAWFAIPGMVKPRRLDLRWSGGRGDGTVIMVGFAPQEEGISDTTAGDDQSGDDDGAEMPPPSPVLRTSSPLRGEGATDKPTVSRRKPGARKTTAEKSPRKRLPRKKKKPRDGEIATESGRGDSPVPGGGIGDGLDAGGVVSRDAPNVLAKIRREIARRQYYPESARAQKLKGTVRVNFMINAAGDLSYVTVAESSGHAVLDSAAVHTVKKAAPFPFYPRPITLSLEYRLEAGE